MAFVLKPEQLQAVMPRLPNAKLPQYLPFLNEAMAKYLIDTSFRAAAFLAQLAHESGELKYMEEIWGPTDQQKKYEPPSRVAARLGNTQAGDGYKYRGRGPIQLTGRANYQRFSDILKIDFIRNPDLVSRPEYAFIVAGLFWRLSGLNGLADPEQGVSFDLDDLVYGQDFVEITKKINGGTNGLKDRRRYYERALNVLHFGPEANVGERYQAPSEASTEASTESRVTPQSNS